MACWRHFASKPARIEFVPMTVIGGRPFTGSIPTAGCSVAMMCGLVEVGLSRSVMVFLLPLSPVRRGEVGRGARHEGQPRVIQRRERRVFRYNLPIDACA